MRGLGAQESKPNHGGEWVCSGLAFDAGEKTDNCSSPRLSRKGVLSMRCPVTTGLDACTCSGGGSGVTCVIK